MFGMLTGKMYSYIIGGLGLVIGISFLYIYITGLKQDIEINKAEISNLHSIIVTKDIVIANRDNIIATKEAESKELLDTIDRYNDVVKHKEEALAQSKIALSKWEKLAKEKKYKYITKILYKNKKIDFSVADCRKGIELMRNMSKLDYSKMGEK